MPCLAGHRTRNVGADEVNVSLAWGLLQRTKDCDEFVTFITLGPRKLEEFFGPCEYRGAFGRTCDTDRASASHLDQPFVTEHAQRT